MIRFNKGLDKKRVNVEETQIIAFYIMLVKYKKFHPKFNLNKVMWKLYPNVDWKQIVSK